MRDIKQDNTGDIDLTNGCMQFADPTKQHQRDILLTRKGELKHAPLTGVGIDDYLNDDSPEALLREARKQFIRDGMKVEHISFNNGKLLVNAHYDE